MSKIFSILLIILTLFAFQFTPLIKEVHAAETCTSPAAGISYGNPANGTKNTNTFFLNNSGDLTFEFTMDKNNVLNGKEVFLHLPGGIFGSDNKDTKHTTAGPKFTLTIPSNIAQASQGDHQAELWWPDSEKSGSFTAFCEHIIYAVGTDELCTILEGPSTSLPPDNLIHITFLGRSKKEFELRKVIGSFENATPLGKTTTNEQGIGKFENINIAGKVGDKFRLQLMDEMFKSCQTSEITITSTAPPQPTINPSASINPVPAPVVKKCGDKDDNGNEIICSSGGGKIIEGCNDPDKPGYDPKNPAIATAIGCIHTNPTELVKDFMKFGVGIGGGLAFLMMLLGAFQMLTSAGNPETLNAGKDRLTSAVIGLLFIIFTILLLQIIGADILNIPGFKR